MEKRGQQPLLYRQFRQDFQKILQTSYIQEIIKARQWEKFEKNAAFKKLL